MSPEKVWNALAGYDRDLNRLGFVARQFDTDEYAAKELPRPAVLAHCRWMAQKCLSAFRAEFEAAWAGVEQVVNAEGTAGWRILTAVVEARKPLEKAMRWLCYIQGACHSYGLYSCDELRDHSRGGEGEFKPANEEHAARRYALSPAPAPFFKPSDRHLLKPRETPDPREEVIQIPFPLDPMRKELFTPLDPAATERLKAAFLAAPRVAPADLTPAETARYFELEKEHLGDPEKQTGVYHPDVVARRQARRAAAVAELDACFCTDQHSPPGTPECGKCQALRAEIAAIDAAPRPSVEELLATDKPE